MNIEDLYRWKFISIYNRKLAYYVCKLKKDNKLVKYNIEHCRIKIKKLKIVTGLDCATRMISTIIFRITTFNKHNSKYVKPYDILAMGIVVYKVEWW